MNDREKILLEVMHLMSEKFKDLIVLEGGMLLRLMDSQRETQDVDYALISTKSKKDLAAAIKKTLGVLNDISIGHVEINSRGIFFELRDVEDEGVRALLEISVVDALNLPAGHISTVKLSSKYSMTGRVVSTMALPEAFANKIAAALERDSMRDLYDISILESLCSFDVKTLEKRLQNISIRRKKSKAVSFEEASCMLEEKAERVTQKAIDEELAPLLPTHRREGIELIIKTAVMRTAAKMKVLTISK